MLQGVNHLPLCTWCAQYLPITADVMLLLFDTWSHVPETEHYNAAMLWAACGMGFFGFKWAGEFTYQSWQIFSPTMLTPRDIYIDSHDNPTIVTIHLSHSKTDPFKAGVSIHLGWSGCAVCPVAAILGYIMQHGLHGPLFLFGDRSPFQGLMGRVKQALTQHSINSTGFTGHTFRIGAATSMPLAGLKDSFIHWVTGTHPVSCSIFGPHFRCCIISAPSHAPATSPTPFPSSVTWPQWLLSVFHPFT